MLPLTVDKFLKSHMLENAALHSQLTRHLEMVHETAVLLLKDVDKYLKDDRIDPELVKLGAACHDLGKLFFPEEIEGSGNLHEGNAVVMVLTDQGLDPKGAQFARLHALRTQSDDLNVLLVCIADTIWNGGRDTELELKFCKVLGGDVWTNMTRLDVICERIALGGSKRLQYQKEGTLF